MALPAQTLLTPVIFACRLGGDFWAKKRRGTIERDARNIAVLTNAGWRVLVIWECQSRSDDQVRDILKSQLTNFCR